LIAWLVDWLFAWLVDWLIELTNRGRKRKEERNIDIEKESKEEMMNESGRQINKEPTDGKYKNKIANHTSKVDS
jgi:hypothetical protein